MYLNSSNAVAKFPVIILPALQMEDLNLPYANVNYLRQAFKIQCYFLSAHFLLDLVNSSRLWSIVLYLIIPNVTSTSGKCAQRRVRPKIGKFVSERYSWELMKLQI